MTKSLRGCAPEVVGFVDGIGDQRIRVAIESIAVAAVADDRVVDIRVLTLLTESSGILFPSSRGVRIEVRSVPALIRTLKSITNQAGDT